MSQKTASKRAVATASSASAPFAAATTRCPARSRTSASSAATSGSSSTTSTSRPGPVNGRRDGTRDVDDGAACQRQGQRESGATLGPVLRRQGPAVRRDHAVADREADARADTDGLGGVEGLEDARHDLVRNAGPGVVDLDHGDTRRTIGPGDDGEAALPLFTVHGLHCIDHQIDEHLHDLVAVGKDRRQVVAGIDGDRDAGRPRRIGDEILGRLQNGSDRGRPPVRRGLPRHLEKCLRDPAAALGRFAKTAQMVALARIEHSPLRA